MLNKENSSISLLLLLLLVVVVLSQSTNVPYPDIICP